MFHSFHSFISFNQKSCFIHFHYFISFIHSFIHSFTHFNSQVDTANGMGISTAALITNMDSPIGQAVGNALEVAESIQCLRGEGAADLVELVTALGGRLVELSGKGSAEDGTRMIAETLTDGSALAKFRQMLVCQGVSEQDAQELCHGDIWKVLTKATTVEDVCATDSGMRQVGIEPDRFTSPIALRSVHLNVLQLMSTFF